MKSRPTFTLAVVLWNPFCWGPFLQHRERRGKKKGLWPTQVLIATTAAAAKALVSLINMSEE